MFNATICKEFTFDAAHYLPNHNGKCRNLHGHTYKVLIYVRGEVKDIDGDSDEGMVVDFGVVKEVYKRRIEAVCDHQYLNDALPIPRTSAEWMAFWMLKEMRKEMEEVFKVRVYETPTSYAEVEVDNLV